MKRKVFLTMLSVVFCLVLSMCFFACTVENKDSRDKQIVAVYNTYVAYAEENGQEPLSYTEWLETIKGKDGETPTVEISSDGYWVINGSKTIYKAIGEKGDDGYTPTIEISSDGYWIINGNKTEHKAIGEKGNDGYTPTIEISNDGYWIINGNKTEHKAIGEKGETGKDGLTPYIGKNGNWWIGEKDTGVFASYNYETREITSGLIFTTMTVKGQTGLVLTDFDKSLWQEQNPECNVLNIPDYVGMTPVIGVKAELFENQDYIEKVSFSKNTIYLGKDVFYGCDNLKEVDFNGAPLEEVPEYAFYDAALKEIELPTTCKKIGKYCFYNNPLKKINYENVTSFGEYCLSGYYGKPIYLRKDVEYVGNNVFTGNYVYIEHEVVPTTWGTNIAGTNELSGYVTANCLINDEYIYSKENNQVTIYNYIGEAKRINVPSKIDNLTVTKIGYGFNSISEYAIDVIEERIGTFNLEFCSEIVRLEKVVLPNTIKGIDFGAFQCLYTMIYIPSSVESMWVGVGIWDLDEEDSASCYLMFESNDYPTLKYKWLENSNSYEDAKAVYDDCAIRTALGIKLQNVFYDIENKAYYLADAQGYSLMAYMDYTTSEIHIPTTINNKSVHTVKTGAVSGFYCVRSIIIGNGIKKIQRNAFVNCEEVLSIYIPNSVTIINGNGFANICKTFYTSHLSLPDEWDTQWAGASTSSVKINFNVKQKDVPSVSEDGLYAYRVLSDNTIELVSYLGTSATTYKVPRVIDGKRVSKICSNCYNISTSSTVNIYVPKSITEIAANAFYRSYSSTTNVYFESESKLTGYDSAYINVSQSYLREYLNRELNY